MKIAYQERLKKIETAILKPQKFMFVILFEYDGDKQKVIYAKETTLAFGKCFFSIEKRRKRRAQRRFMQPLSRVAQVIFREATRIERRLTKLGVDTW